MNKDQKRDNDWTDVKTHVPIKRPPEEPAHRFPAKPTPAPEKEQNNDDDG